MPDHSTNAPLYTAALSNPLDSVSSPAARGSEAHSSDHPLVPRILSPQSSNHSHERIASHADPTPTPDARVLVPGSSTAIEDDSDTPDGAIIDALKNPKERLFVLKLGEHIENLILGPSKASFDLSPATSYQRMLVHRCATYYKVTLETEGQTKNIVVSLAPESRMPSIRMADLVPAEASTLPAFKIMRRSANDRLNSRNSRSNSADPDSDDGQGSEAGSSGRTGGISHKKKQRMTIEEREAAYNEARSRIFLGYEDKEGVIASASSSTQSLASPLPGGDSTASTTSNSDDVGPVTPSEASVKPGVKNGPKRGGAIKERWSESNHASSSTSLTDDDAEFNRNGFSYPSLYEPIQATGYEPALYSPPGADPSHAGDSSLAPLQYPMYPPYANYPPSYMGPYAYYPYDPRHYPYPPPDTQNGSMPGAPMPNATSPYSLYPPGATWYPHPVGPAVAPGPVPTGTPQRNGQPAPPISPNDPRFMSSQVASGMFYPQQTRPINMNGSQAPPPMRMGTLYSPSTSSVTTSPQSPRPSIGSRSSSRSASQEIASSPATRMRINGTNGSPMSTGIPPPLPRNPWSFGPGLGVPDRRRAGSSSSRAGSVSSRSGSGSTGAMTPADETGSIASSETSSSSSRKTFTSNSSKHPLPARPDWAINLPIRGSNHHSRTSSAVSTPSVTQSITDFPPLPSGSLVTTSLPTKAATTSTTQSQNLRSESSDNVSTMNNSVWKSPGAARSLLLNNTDNHQPHQRHSSGSGQPTSGGVTLGVSLSSLNFPPSNRPHPTGPSNQLPAIPTSGVNRQSSVHTRLDEHDQGFNRPPPKSSELFNPKGAPRRAVSTTISEKDKSVAQRATSELDDKLRGEAVANAILVDRVSSLHLSTSNGAMRPVTTSSSTEEGSSGRRASAPSNGPSTGGKLSLANIEGLTLAAPATATVE